MPFETLDIQAVAKYLHLDQREVSRMASRGKLPCRKRKGDYIFLKADIDHWVERQLHELPHKRLAQIEAGVRKHHGMPAQQDDALMVSSMIPDGGVIVPLPSRTAASAIRDLVGQGEQAGLVWDRQRVLDAINEREQMCSTAIMPYLALPHPRHPLPYDIGESFVIVGLSDRGVPFASADGSLVRLFFLICCKDDRTHLHVLARLGRMLQNPESREQLLHAESADHLLKSLRHAEREAVACPLDR